MITTTLEFYRHAPNVKSPEKAKEGDSGFDVFAHHFVEGYIIKNGQEYMVEADANGVIPEITNVRPTGMFAANGRPVPAPDSVWINPGERVVIGTGLSCRVTSNTMYVYELQARPRSGLARKKGLTVLNTPGTVDSKFTGEICITVINHSGIAQKITLGDKIAQLVPCEVPQSDLYEVFAPFKETERGDKGFGSTGT